jgi:N-methylhydantoinase A
MAHSFAVDIGGTFTDLVVLDVETGDLSFTKASTTPEEPALGVLEAIGKSELSLPGARAFFHGTTLGINAMLEHKGDRCGLLTTQGCRDILELRRMDWPGYQLHWTAPPPIVPRALRREVVERVRADGTVLTALDETSVIREARVLVSEGIESVAVCLMHAYAYPEHELAVGAILRREFPQLSVTLSHEVTQEYREYERTTTAVSDAAIKRRMASYLDSLDGKLQREQFSGAFLVTRCDGGAMSAAEARERPIRTLTSGPASGVMAVVTMSRWLGLPNMIGADMGGTSFDASLVIDHEPTLGTSTEIGGFPLLIPVIELATIGAGGGSIAWIDTGGALNVGPQSAGAQPGPVCYGRGGSSPTFTDAAVVSGLLDPNRFLGGEMMLDVQSAREVVQDQIARPLGLTVEQAAAGIVTLTEAKMAATLEELTIAQGHDPRDFTLVAYGGGGSLVASALAARLSIPRIVVPQSPGTFSAWGMLTLDIVHDHARTSLAALQQLSPSDLDAGFRDLEDRAVEALEREGVPHERRSLLRFVDLRYEGQEHVLTVPLGSTVGDLSPDRLRQLFDERHRAAYRYVMTDPAEVTAYRVRGLGSLEKPRRPSLAPAGDDAEHARIGSRSALHEESGGPHDWATYDRHKLLGGNRVDGPAIIEEMAATTLVAPGQTATVDELGNLIITTDGRR